jgi:hypothetical protein
VFFESQQRLQPLSRPGDGWIGFSARIEKNYLFPFLATTQEDTDEHRKSNNDRRCFTEAFTLDEIGHVSMEYTYLTGLQSQDAIQQ